MFDEKCLVLAELFFSDVSDDFPADQHAALVKLLAQDIQDAIQDFAEFPDLTLKHLERVQRKARG